MTRNSHIETKLTKNAGNDAASFSFRLQTSVVDNFSKLADVAYPLLNLELHLKHTRYVT
jgi:hypothetical protein